MFCKRTLNNYACTNCVMHGKYTMQLYTHLPSLSQLQHLGSLAPHYSGFWGPLLSATWKILLSRKWKFWLHTLFMTRLWWETELEKKLASFKTLYSNYLLLKKVSHSELALSGIFLGYSVKPQVALFSKAVILKQSWSKPERGRILLESFKRDYSIRNL